MSKRCEQVARNFHAATTQMGAEADAESEKRCHTSTAERQAVLSELFRDAWGGELYLRMKKQIMTEIANKKN